MLLKVRSESLGATPFLSLKAYGNTPIEARGIVVELEVALVDIYEKGSIACVDIHEGDGGEGELGQTVDHIAIPVADSGSKDTGFQDVREDA